MSVNDILDQPIFLNQHTGLDFSSAVWQYPNQEYFRQNYRPLLGTTFVDFYNQV